MNRRDVLRAAAALPALFGLGGCSRAPSWFGEALARIRRDGKPGLVLRLPKDPALRCRYGHTLWWLMEDTEASNVAISRQAVFLCLEDDAVRTLLSGAREKESLLLIDGQGVVQDGRPLEDPIGLPGAAGDLLAGPKRAAPSRGPVEKTEAPLPYGASIETGRIRCAEDPNCRNGTCGACGMAVITSRSREFVKFLAK